MGNHLLPSLALYEARYKPIGEDTRPGVRMWCKFCVDSVSLARSE